MFRVTYQYPSGYVQEINVIAKNPLEATKSVKTANPEVTVTKVIQIRTPLFNK